IEPDSLSLDLSDPVGPPFGCNIRLSGTLTTSRTASGVIEGRCGHDPPFAIEWAAEKLEASFPYEVGPASRCYGVRNTAVVRAGTLKAPFPAS
ncbi:MAG: hypothetical protein FD129_2283, partial [bacterium]